MAGPEEWEGAAAELLDATCTTAPVDALELAAACGLEVRTRPRAGAVLDGSVLWVEERARPERFQGLIAHELGHVALDRSRLPQSERGATYVGGALRLPRREMLRDLRETAWSITALRARHPHASATAIAVRITQLRTACVALFDVAATAVELAPLLPAIETAPKGSRLIIDAITNTAWLDDLQLDLTPLQFDFVCDVAIATMRSGTIASKLAGSAALGSTRGDRSRTKMKSEILKRLRLQFSKASVPTPAELMPNGRGLFVSRGNGWSDTFSVRVWVRAAT